MYISYATTHRTCASSEIQYLQIFKQAFLHHRGSTGTYYVHVHIRYQIILKTCAFCFLNMYISNFKLWKIVFHLHFSMNYPLSFFLINSLMCWFSLISKARLLENIWRNVLVTTKPTILLQIFYNFTNLRLFLILSLNPFMPWFVLARVVETHGFIENNK